ncbi:MAG: dihydrolipoamide acetyltransferase family protein [archaeon]|nr:dihydrolipoamide acetyltransferase family protein [archaeon]
MVLEFKLPDLGEGVAEGEIVKWLVNEGQQIKEDEPMVEVMTDKATVQIPSPASGTVKQILAKEGQTVKVGTNLVVLDNSGGKDGGSVGTQTVQKIAPDKTPERRTESVQQTQISQAAQRVIATPATRKLARDLGIEIEKVSGSGPGGRITEEDVKRTGSGQRQPPRPTQQTMQQQVERPVEQARPSQAVPQTQPSANEERVSIHGIRKLISEKMLKSTQTTSAVTHIDEVDFTELVALRDATRPLAESQNVKLTYLPFIMKAVTTALKQFPFFNASIDDQTQEFIVKHYHNIGFATDTPNGLMVPVVKNADRKNIFEIATEIERLSEEARSGKIQLQDLQGGTFTITNIGALGGVMSTPIINVPEVAILGVHKIQKKPVVLKNEIAIRDIAYVALTFDHRIVDGADAARFTSRLKQYLENPSLIFVEASLNEGQR